MEEWPTASEEQLSQECSDEALLSLSKEIAGYDNYKHRLDLSSAEIEDIDKNPSTFTSSSGKLHAAFRKWKSKSIDMDNPSLSTATYGQLVAIAKKENDGEAARHIHKTCVDHTGTKLFYHTP